VIYIFYGADSFSRGEAFEELRASLDEDGALESNTLRMAAREAKPGEVIAACAAAPFLGGQRLVVLEGLLRLAEEGAGRRRKTVAPEDAAGPWQALVEFAPGLPESTTLVILDGAASATNPLLKALAALGTVQEFKPPDAKQLAGWVQARARKLGLQLESGAVRLLAQTVGGQGDQRARENLDTWALAAELDKLAAYAKGEVIRERDVRELSPVLRQQKSYLLSDAVAEKRPAAATKLLAELLGQREPGQLVIANIAGRYRRLAIARDMLDRGEPVSAIGRELGSSGYALERLVEQAGRYSPEDIRAAYQRIVEAEFSHKTGVGEESVELELLVQELAGGAGV
jgi:DNA polymerase-3 subunit delta